MLRRFLNYLFSAKLSEARSPQWSRERAAWLEQNGRCAACGATDNLTVHHIRPFTYYPELELNRSNFLTLCEGGSTNHHLDIGHAGNWRTWNPHAVEDAALMLQRRKERKTGR